MFKSRVSENKEKLTYLEEKIASFLIENYSNDNESELLTSDEVARRVGCAQATVARFARKLEYNSYKSMMLDLLNESIFSTSTEVKKGETISETNAKLSTLYKTLINEVTSCNKESDIEKVANELNNAHTIFCYGVRTSSAVAETLFYRLIETGRTAVRALTSVEAITFANSLTKDDVMFVVSVSGETAEVIATTKIAKEHGAKIVSITESANNTLQKLSDIALKSSEYNIHTEKFNIVCRAAEMYLMDLIFTRYWKINEEQHVVERNEFIENINKYPLVGQYGNQSNL